ERAEREPVVFLEPRSVEGDFEVRDLIDHLFREDEQFVAMDPGGDRLMERFGLVLVRDDKVEGLPERAPAALKEAILEAAAGATLSAKDLPASRTPPSTSDQLPH